MKFSPLLFAIMSTITLALLSPPNGCYSQSRCANYTINKIKINGYKRTRPLTILHEFSIKESKTYTVADYEKEKQETINRLYDTELFTSITWNDTILPTCEIQININFQERWYTFPIVILGFGDRNFNEWYQTYNHDIRRLNLGFWFYQRNITGRNDNLLIGYQTGFTKKYGFRYLLRGVGKNKKSNIEINALLTKEKKTAIQIKNNKLEFYSSDQYSYSRFFSGITYFYLPNPNTQLAVDATYHRFQISDEINRINSNYLLNKTRREGTSFYVSLMQFKRDNKIYPLNAFLYKLEFVKIGMLPSDNLNNTWLNGKINLHKQLGYNFFVSQSFQAKYDFTNQRQPFRLARALGYDEYYVRGYELYVLDGQHYFLNRNTIKKRIINKHITVPYLKDNRFSNLPLTAYLKAFADYGYVWNKFENPMSTLPNTSLMSYGIGIDILPLYSLVVRVEYTRNKLKENGVFLHFNLDIGNDNSHIW